MRPSPTGGSVGTDLPPSHISITASAEKDDARINDEEHALGMQANAAAYASGPRSLHEACSCLKRRFVRHGIFPAPDPHTQYAGSGCESHAN